jgi:hypothetical protein
LKFSIDSDQNDESIPASEPIAMPEIISRSSNSTAPSETAAIKRTSGTFWMTHHTIFA